jgi:hypothetical protein
VFVDANLAGLSSESDNLCRVAKKWGSLVCGQSKKPKQNTKCFAFGEALIDLFDVFCKVKYDLLYFLYTLRI